MKHVEPEVRAVLVARLRAKRASGSSVTADVRRAAAALVVGESALTER